MTAIQIRDQAVERKTKIKRRFAKVPYDNCVGVPISHLLTMGPMHVYHSVLNVKAPVAPGAFSMIMNLV